MWPTALMLAAGVGQTDVLILLLANGSDTDPVDRAGNNAEILAIRNGHTRTALVLRDVGSE